MSPRSEYYYRARIAAGRAKRALIAAREGAATPAGAPPIKLPPEPISRRFGFDRGKPVDRRYIERFIDINRNDVRGRVLEVAESTYTEWYGDDRVTQSEILYASGDLVEATYVGDLARVETLPEGLFDCFICTQTLQLIYDVRAAVQGTRHVLAPGGVVLCTLPGISHTSTVDRDRWGDAWRFTSQSAAKLFGDVYGPENVTVEAHGNVRVAAAFLYGLAVEDLDPADFERDDRDYELVITVRARRTD